MKTDQPEHAASPFVPAWAAIDAATEAHKFLDDLEPIASRTEIPCDGPAQARRPRSEGVTLRDRRLVQACDSLLRQRRVYDPFPRSRHSVRAMDLNASARYRIDGDVIWRCTGSGGEVTTDPSFGALLKRLRQQADLSQKQLAVKIGTTQSAIARLEANAAQPKLATLSKLAAALGEDLQVLVSGRGDR